MIEKYIQVLKKVRAGELELKNFFYEEAKNKEGYAYDKNATKRFQLLIALQYNRQATDEAILVELFKAEIKRHQKAPFQGLHPALKLNAFLLSLYPKTAYSTLYLEAKKANFDTHCGFDYQFLLAAGIAETYQFFQKEQPELAEVFWDYVGDSVDNCSISEAELSEWKGYLVEEYPDTLILEDIIDEIDLAIDLDEMEILQDKIDLWKGSKSSWSESDLNQLNYYQGLIEDLAGQIVTQGKLLQLATSDWDKAALFQRLSKLLIANCQLDSAWEKIKESQSYLQKISDWKTVGLGRFMIENAFDVVLGINDKENPIAQEAFQWSSQEVKNMENLHLNLLEKIVQGAALMEDLQLSNQYKKILKQEREQLDQILYGK